MSTIFMEHDKGVHNLEFEPMWQNMGEAFRNGHYSIVARGSIVG
jgi:hypothetical protein